MDGERTPARGLGLRLVGLLAVVGLAAAIAGATWSSQLTVTRQPRHNVPAGELTAGRCFGQTFEAEFSGLYRIDVLLATYARENRGPVRLQVRESPDGESIASVEIDARDVVDNAYHAFRFDALEETAGETLFFCLEAPQATSGNAITVWRADFDAYDAGQAFVDGAPLTGDLAFALHYRARVGEVWHTLSRAIRAHSPLLWRTRYLMAGAAAAWILGIGWLLGEVLVLNPERERT